MRQFLFYYINCKSGILEWKVKSLTNELYVRDNSNTLFTHQWYLSWPLNNVPCLLPSDHKQFNLESLQRFAGKSCYQTRLVAYSGQIFKINLLNEVFFFFSCSNANRINKKSLHFWCNSIACKWWHEGLIQCNSYQNRKVYIHIIKYAIYSNSPLFLITASKTLEGKGLLHTRCQGDERGREGTAHRQTVPSWSQVSGHRYAVDCPSPTGCNASKSQPWWRREVSEREHTVRENGGEVHVLKGRKNVN